MLPHINTKIGHLQILVTLAMVVRFSKKLVIVFIRV